MDVYVVLSYDSGQAEILDASIRVGVVKYIIKQAR